MLVGLLFVIGGVLLCKYGISAVIAGLGTILVSLGLKKDES